MSSYTITGDTDILVLVPGLYELRIMSVEFVSDASAGVWVGYYSNTGGSVSGGTNTTVGKLRSSSPAASATCRNGASVSGGSAARLGLTYVNPTTSVTYSGGGSWTGSTAQVQTPLTTTVAPGSILYVTGLSSPGYLWATVYFEELRLAGSY